MKHGYVLNVMSNDRPGIVAGVSAAIASLDGNIESCSQTVLNGYFTLIMTFSLPKTWKIDALRETILRSKGLDDCQAMIQPMSEISPPAETNQQDVFVITASGPDCKSIVASFSSYLAGKEINILDLYGDITPDGDFVLISQVAVQKNLDIQKLQFDLEELGQDLGFTVRLQHNNIFVATNQLRLYR